MVTDAVTEAVVDRLEVIEIEEHHGNATAGPTSVSYRALDPIPEERSVRQTGQCIVLCSPLRVRPVADLTGQVHRDQAGHDRGCCDEALQAGHTVDAHEDDERRGRDRDGQQAKQNLRQPEVRRPGRGRLEVGAQRWVQCRRAPEEEGRERDNRDRVAVHDGATQMLDCEGGIDRDETQEPRREKAVRDDPFVREKHQAQ